MDRNQSSVTEKTDNSKHETEHLEYVGQHGKHIGIRTGSRPTHPTEDKEWDQPADCSYFERDSNDGRQIVDWDSHEDSENPFNWSTKYKWIVTLTTCFISILLGLPAGAYGTAGSQMAHIWHINEDRFPFISFGLVTWNVGAAVFPLVFVPMTETVGRMPGYFISYILFLIWLIPCAVSQNFATILVSRFFAGGASSVAINVVGGTITDIWKGDRARSLPMSVFALSGVVGIALGPLIGGAITSGINWRWIYWIQLIVDAALLPVFYMILTETRGDVILARRAATMRKCGRNNAYARSELEKVSILQNIKVSFMRPTKMLATEFVVIAFTLWVSFAWGILFLFQSSVPIVFEAVYGFNTLQVVLVQLALVVGAILAALANPVQDKLYLKSAKRNMERPGKPIPEARLYFAVPGSIIFSAGMFWFGWASIDSLHWIVPTLGLGCVGIGVYSIYLAVVNFLADAYEKYAGSALSAASMGRNVFGAFLPLATPALYKNVGFQWASSLIGLVGLALSVVPVILLIKGESIRAKSPFMLEASYDEEESDERRESLAVRHTAERSAASTMPWSHVRTIHD